MGLPEHCIHDLMVVIVLLTSTWFSILYTLLHFLAVSIDTSVVFVLVSEPLLTEEIQYLYIYWYTGFEITEQQLHRPMFHKQNYGTCSTG